MAVCSIIRETSSRALAISASELKRPSSIRASREAIILRAASKSFGSAARAPSRISKISPRWRTQEADNGTPRASSTIEMAVVNFSIESMDHFPATRRLSASLMLDGTIEETSPP